MRRIAVIGVGRIGLCLALNLERAGYAVMGIDKNAEQIQRMREGTFQTPEPGVEEALNAARSLCLVADLEAIREFDPEVVFVAVDTPTGENGVYDHGHVDRVMAGLFSRPSKRDRTELSLVCTTMPGYCDSKTAWAWEHGYALSYTPGFVAQGSILRDQQLPDQVLIGEADAVAGERLERVYRSICLHQPAIHRMSALSAEIAKLATNCALTMKIAFANAIGDLAASVGAEPDRILAAIGADTRIGNKFLNYGFGYGGPCFSRDNTSLSWFAREQGCEFLQGYATDEMNRRHLAFQVSRYLTRYSESEPIHFDHITYKPGTDTLEESQPLLVALELARAGRTVIIHDGPAVVAALQQRFGNLFHYYAHPEEASREIRAKVI